MSPGRFPRSERVRAAVKEVLANEIERLKDPGLGLVTITEVTMSPDLRSARVYWTVYGDEGQRGRTGAALGRASRHLRKAVADGVRLRFVPTLEFVEDPVPERTRRLDQLLAELRPDEEDER